MWFDQGGSDQTFNSLSGQGGGSGGGGSSNTLCLGKIKSIETSSSTRAKAWRI